MRNIKYKILMANLFVALTSTAFANYGDAGKWSLTVGVEGYTSSINNSSYEYNTTSDLAYQDPHGVIDQDLAPEAKQKTFIKITAKSVDLNKDTSAKFEPKEQIAKSVDLSPDATPKPGNTLQKTQHKMTIEDMLKNLREKSKNLTDLEPSTTKAQQINNNN